MIRERLAQTFLSLSVRNYRLFFTGQAISMCGTWMQRVALGWLVLTVSGSGAQLGFVLAAQFLPMLLGGPFAGIITDRLDKRKILYVTQSFSGLLSLLISIMIFTGTIELWMVYAFSFLLGVTNTIDSPTRQTFVHEMVGREFLRNAVTLNSTQANLARVIGPAIAGSLIAGIGIGMCFLVNALSFVAVLTVLSLIRPGELHGEPSEQKEDDIFEGLRYVARTPLIRNILIMIGITGTFSYEFQVSLPLFAQKTFLGDAATYALLMSAMGIGSVIGGLFTASRTTIAFREYVISSTLFGMSMCVTALMPTFGLALLGMVAVGFFSIIVTSVGATMIQLESLPHMRGRVMSFWTMGTFGSTVIGAPAIGLIAEHFGARSGLIAGGLAAILAAIIGTLFVVSKNQLFSIPTFIKIRSEEERNLEDTKV